MWSCNMGFNRRTYLQEESTVPIIGDRLRFTERRTINDSDRDVCNWAVDRRLSEVLGRAQRVRGCTWNYRWAHHGSQSGRWDIALIWTTANVTEPDAGEFMVQSLGVHIIKIHTAIGHRGVKNGWIQEPYQIDRPNQIPLHKGKWVCKVNGPSRIGSRSQTRNLPQNLIKL
jgi:hypothetical protein